MKYLLDVSTLLAWLWKDHEHHLRVLAWQEGKSVAICPITELGFLRISTQPAFGASMTEARELLSEWTRQCQPMQVWCDISALKGSVASTSGKTTDIYLANLALNHGLSLATLDEGVDHDAAAVIPRL